MIDSVPRAPLLGQDQRKRSHLGQLRTSLGRQWVSLGSNDNHFILMHRHYGESRIIDRLGSDAEVNLLRHHGLQRSRSLIARNGHGHARIFFLELRKDLRQDVQAGGLIGADHQFAARGTGHLRQCAHDISPRLQRLFCILQEQFAAGGQRDPTAGSIKQPSAHIFFKATNLGGNCRLRAKQLFCRAGKTRVSGHFDKCFELVKVHSYCPC